jgi:hypothetical protein
MKAFIFFLVLTGTACAHKTALEAARASAKYGLAHRGGHRFYEGLGAASTPERSYKSCCYSGRTDLITYDSATVQAKNGLFVTCRRYVHKSKKHLIPELLRKAGITKP